VTDLPIARIKDMVRPTGDQLAALDELSAAVAKANDAIKASCPTAVPLTPVARLDAAAARLQAMIQALDIVRDPYLAARPSRQRHARPSPKAASKPRRQESAIRFACERQDWPR
jgi:hypothetical protein